MTKTKNKFYLFAFAFIFLSVFLVRVDGVKNVAKAADCNKCVEDCVEFGQSEYDCTFDFCSNECGGGFNGPLDNTPSGSNPSMDYQYCNDPANENDPACYTVDESNPYQQGVMDAGNYNACAAYCQSVDGGNACTSQCSLEYSQGKNGGNGSGTDYVCEDGYENDPKDPASCIPKCEGANMHYSYKFDDCRGGVGAYCSKPEDQDICGDGYICGSDNRCVTSGLFSNGEFGSGDTAKKPATSEEKAAAKANAMALSVKAQAAEKATVAAQQLVKTACAATGATSEADCAKAQAALVDAQTKLDNAINAAIGAVQEANAVSGNSSVGAGFNLCANGILAMVCTGGGGTPYVAGISSGYSGGGGGGFPTSYGSSGVSNQPKCGANFEDVGGVCFPMNTGLSSASISSILINLFSWLMGLFTTLAVLAFVISGVQYFMATGNESMAETAKENATNAIIGIIVGLSGFIIIKAIAAALSGQSILF
ncbi:MAG: pilin [Candidatus Moranbacteria bacterium]|nr:pilin [Candidatus Moranbacteria bacterium]